MRRCIVRGLATPLFAIAIHGCSFAPEKGSPPPNLITQDASKPGRIRFVVHGDPGLARYPEIDQLRLPTHEKIREGMRRFAADELRDRGWCATGFSGPEVVLGYETERLTRRFYVDCL